MPGQHRHQNLATLAVLAAALLFGTTGTVLVNAPAAADAYSVGRSRPPCWARWCPRGRCRPAGWAGIALFLITLVAVNDCHHLYDPVLT